MVSQSVIGGKTPTSVSWKGIKRKHHLMILKSVPRTAVNSLVLVAGGVQPTPGGGGHLGHPPGRPRGQQSRCQDPGWLPRPHDS